MPGESEPPNLIGPDVWIAPGVDTGGKRFWFPSVDPARYPWEIRGHYEVLEGEILITEVTIRLSDEAGPPNTGLDWERIRRLTRLSPIKEAILHRVSVESPQFEEAQVAFAEEGRGSKPVDRWIEMYGAVLLKSDAGPRMHRYGDEEWAGWAADYIRRVADKGSAYGVQGDIAAAKAWGKISYHTVRDRIKTMRRHGWLQGKGHLVAPGPRLESWLDSTARSSRAPRL